MTTSGRTVYRSINSKIEQVEQEHQQLNSTLRSYEQQIITLTAKREDYFGQLATFYLPEMEAEDVKKTIRELQTEVDGIFQQKQKRRQDLEELMNTSEEKKGELKKQLDGINQRLEEKDSQRDSVQKEVSQELDANPQYILLHTHTQQAQSRLDQNKKRHEAFSREATQKLQVYEEEPLFMYLVKRNFGTAEYRASGLAERLDRRVAKLVLYQEMKAQYDFLKSMPAAIKVEIDRQQESVDALVRQIEALEKEVTDRRGLTKIVEEGQALILLKKRNIGEIEQEDRKIQGYVTERKDLDSTKDPYHRTALDRLKGYLKGESVTALKERARGTPDPRDDRLAEQIDDINAAVKDLKGKAKAVQQQQSNLAEKLQGLREVASGFSSKDYDSQRSYFKSGFDIDSYLTGFLSGRYSTSDINSHLDSYHRRKPVETYSSYSSRSYTPSYHSGGFGGGGHSSSGGFGGGGHFSSGGFGGGGHSTTGGF